MTADDLIWLDGMIEEAGGDGYECLDASDLVSLRAVRAEIDRLRSVEACYNSAEQVERRLENDEAEEELMAEAAAAAADRTYSDCKAEIDRLRSANTELLAACTAARRWMDDRREPAEIVEEILACDVAISHLKGAAPCPT